MQRPLGGQDELMSRGFREPAHRPRPEHCRRCLPVAGARGRRPPRGRHGCLPLEDSAGDARCHAQHHDVDPSLSVSSEEDAARHLAGGLAKPSACPGRVPGPRPKRLLLSAHPPHRCVWGSSVQPDTRVGTVLPTPRPLGSGLARTLRIRGVGQELVPGSHVGGRSPPGYSFGPGGTKTRDPFHRNGPLHWNMPKARGPLSPADDGAGSLSRGVLGLVGGWAVSLPPPDARSTPNRDGRRCPHTLPSVAWRGRSRPERELSESRCWLHRFFIFNVTQQLALGSGLWARSFQGFPAASEAGRESPQTPRMLSGLQYLGCQPATQSPEQEAAADDPGPGSSSRARGQALCPRKSGSGALVLGERLALGTGDSGEEPQRAPAPPPRWPFGARRPGHGPRDDHESLRPSQGP